MSPADYLVRARADIAKTIDEKRREIEALELMAASLCAAEFEPDAMLLSALLTAPGESRSGGPFTSYGPEIVTTYHWYGSAHIQPDAIYALMPSGWRLIEEEAPKANDMRIEHHSIWRYEDTGRTAWLYLHRWIDAQEAA